jgi:uncharacterized protein (TIGR04222 family)
MMFPFDLRGPEFLLFYFGLSLFTIIGCWIWRRSAESGEPPKLNLADPYLIAYLRGGANETIRIATISLIERGFLKIKDKSLERTEQTTEKKFDDATLPKVESALLQYLKSSAEPKHLFKTSYLSNACQPYRHTLEQAGLLPSDRQQNARGLVFALAALLLVGIGLYKVFIGLWLDRPVFFLVLMMIAAIIFMAIAMFPRLTPRGHAMLADVRSLYGGLRNHQQTSLVPHDAMLLAAAFGIGSLENADYAYAGMLFPQAQRTSSGSCGSSCGSGCGSSGCGGGGCGGCGGS